MGKNSPEKSSRKIPGKILQKFTTSFHSYIAYECLIAVTHRSRSPLSSSQKFCPLFLFQNILFHLVGSAPSVQGQFRVVLSTVEGIARVRLVPLCLHRSNRNETMFPKKKFSAGCPADSRGHLSLCNAPAPYKIQKRLIPQSLSNVCPGANSGDPNLL